VDDEELAALVEEDVPKEEAQWNGRDKDNVTDGRALAGGILR
jgi:hypothetical protein